MNMTTDDSTNNKQPKQRKPFRWRSDSDPDFISSLEHCKTVLRAKFLEKQKDRLQQACSQPTQPVVTTEQNFLESMTKKKVTEEQEEVLHHDGKPPGPYVKDYGWLKSKTGQVVHVTNLCSFLYSVGLDKSHSELLLMVFQGKALNFRGWYLYSPPKTKP